MTQQNTSEFLGSVSGSGPGVLLAHGASSDIEDSFGPIVPRLAEANTVVAVDYPGSGRTPRATARLTLDGLADGLVDAARRAGQEQFAVAGFSTGAAVAVRIATRHRPRVTGLALSAGFAHPNARLRLVVATWRQLAASGDTRSLAAYLTLLGWSPGWLDGRSGGEIGALVDAIGPALPAGADDQLDLLTRVDVRPELAGIRVPTVVIAGAHDLVVSASHPAELATGIPNARLVELDSGHALASERPAEWAEVINDFLAAQVPRRR
ncbi:alpha/beta fold hydrolase [Nocardia flavorosea]|uniref:Alpha/beta hydrolase n=1 Tax=Nocardia flavorosea TaxID=53429 RepID=A0A846YH31_9NOCA|nr:alpha/beta hydrolase [Nocardia flavorosea]NKY58233.1 alpha/beta hydrolase [Nocardia flavorosea]